MKSILIVALFGVAFGFAQHPGAYSSPHYAKKNTYTRPYNQPSPYSIPEYQKVNKIQEVAQNEQQFVQQQQQINSNNYQQLDKKENIANHTNLVARSSGFMASVSNFLSGRGGQMLADIAREVIARSAGATSQVGGECIAQVLSLNLTNLVILVVLKALILGAGMFGAGSWHHGYARSLNDENSVWIEEKELKIWMSYLEGGDYACLMRASCKMPEIAKKYISGAELLLISAKMLPGIVPYDVKYEKILERVKEASKWGDNNLNCDLKYTKCSDQLM